MQKPKFMQHYFSFLLLIILVSCQTQSDSKKKINTIAQKEEIQNKPMADNKDSVLNILEEDTIFLTVNGHKVLKTIDKKTCNIKEVIFTSDSTINEYMVNEQLANNVQTSLQCRDENGNKRACWTLTNPVITKVLNTTGRLISEEIAGEMYGDHVEIERKYYEDEQIKSELIEGADESLQREWYKNGQLKYKDISTYSDNLNNERYVDSWYENGQISYQFAHHQEMDGFYFYRSWYENGQMKHNEKGGLEQPEFCDWFPEQCDEEQLAELELVNEAKLADTTITFFIKNWYENGQLENEKNNIILRCWHKDGQLKKETFYKKNNEGESIITSQQCWDKKGNKIDCSKLTNPCNPKFIHDIDSNKDRSMYNG